MSRRLRASDIARVFNIELGVSDAMQDAINLWSAIYQNAAPWLVPKRNEMIRSLNIGASVASELARLVLLEFQTELELKKTGEQEGLDTTEMTDEPDNTEPEPLRILKEDYIHFLDSLRSYLEQACAQGGCLFKPYTDEKGRIYMNMIPATHIYPVTFAPDGTLQEVVIADEREKQGQYYTLLEYRKFENNSEEIRYKVFKSAYAGNLGTEVSIVETGLWPDIPPSAGLLISNITRPLFIYFKLPFANTIDPLSQLGISAYAKAVGLLEDADIQYSRYLWEYKAGEFAVNVDGAALEIDSSRGFNVANLDRRIYRGVDIKDLFEAWNPNLRDASYYAGLNNILRAIEFKCGLSYNTISDADDKEKTATEIISSRQRSYGTVREIQRSLEVALQRLIEVMCELRGISYESIESVFDWGDSILVDKEVEKGMFMQEIAAGIRAPWEYRVKFMGETQERAKERIMAIEKERDRLEFQFDEELPE